MTDEPWKHYFMWEKTGTYIEWFCLYEMSRRVKFIETESKWVAARGYVEEGLRHDSVSFKGMKGF